MQHTHTLPAVPSSADDAVLAEALAEVDLKLTAWLSAVFEAHAHLPGAPLDPDSIPAALDLPTGRPVPTDDSEPPHPAAAGGDADAGVDAALAAPPARSEPGAAAVTRGAALEAPAQPEAPAVAPVHADQALLEALDPETRKEIHVRQRCCSYRKSVRELLAELESERANRASAPTPKQKHWWRKG